MTSTWRIAESCPWPYRVGLLCEIVTEQMDPAVYPRRGVGQNEVIVRIDDDPLVPDRPWTCVLDRNHLVPADRAVAVLSPDGHNLRENGSEAQV